jgi:hypothetical protein
MNAFFKEPNQYSNERKVVGMFIKVLEKKYVEDFVKRGILYMNSLDTFRSIEDQGIRGDKDEGAHASFDAESSRLNIGGKDIHGIIGRMRINYDYERNINIFCMTGLPYNILMPIGSVFKLSSKFSEFGDTAVLIPRNNIPILMQRIKRAYNKKTHIQQCPDEGGNWARSVEYVNQVYSGRFGVFRKLEKYSWQHEWRIAVFRKAKNLKAKPYKLSIGSIEDLCFITNVKCLIEEGFRYI